MGTSILERHLQTAIQVVLVTLIIWFGQSTLDVKDKVARLEEQIRALQKDVSAASSDRYTNSQATRDIELINGRIGILERSVESQGEWIRSLRDRHIALESDVRAAGIAKRNDIPPRGGR